MTITTRSKRITAFDSDSSTPSTVAPGSYAIEQIITSFGLRAQRPLFSSFATSERRSLNENKTTSASTPGPGAYTADRCYQHNVTPSNVFASKISRFAPSAPGSTVFCASSLQNNPGPGSYLRLASSPCSNNQREHQKLHKFAHLVKLSVPTIPQRQQSYGYVQVGVELRRQFPPQETYSGVGQDTIGPAAYNCHIWHDNRNGASSFKSIAKRDVWEENNKFLKFPGPGQYDVKTGLETTVATTTMLIPEGPRPRIGVRRRQYQGARQSAVFTSKVPILSVFKPVGGYDLERERESWAKEERAERYRQEQFRLRPKTEAFDSSTGRTDLMSHITTPYRHPTYTTTPGPGRYGAARTISTSKRLEKNASGALIPHHRPDGMGFSCVTERPCLAHTNVSAAPGPGAYKSETSRSLNQAVIVKLATGRHGVFGTTSERTTRGMEPLTPGPGAYSEFGSLGTKHDLNTAAFKSASVRFATNALPHVQCVSDEVSPAIGQYNISKGVLNVASSMLGRHEHANTRNVSGSLSPRVPFLSTQRRSLFGTKDAFELPGPGAYMESRSDCETMYTRSRDIRLTVGNEARFRITATMPDTVGPGTYFIPGTVGTKSFNVTMTRKDQCDDNFIRARQPTFQKSYSAQTGQ